MFNNIDIHGYSVTEAKLRLDSYINNLPITTMQVTVIHGYNGGNALQHFVRKQYRNKRVIKVILTMNFGETILMLK